VRPTPAQRQARAIRQMLVGSHGGRTTQVAPVQPRSVLKPYHPAPTGAPGLLVWDFNGPLVTGQFSDIVGFPKAANFTEIAAALTITGSSDTTVVPIYNGAARTPLVVLHTQVVTLFSFVLSVVAGDSLQFHITSAGAAAAGLVLAAG
jgi:hypothetical protein